MKKVLFLAIIAIILSHNSFAQRKIVVNAVPGGEFIVNSGVDTQIKVVGKGSLSEPFKIYGANNAKLSGNSFIHVLGSNIIIENLQFEENSINYLDSRGLISIGDSKNIVSNVDVKNIKFIGKGKFKTLDGKSQFHFLYVNGDKVTIEKCYCTQKVNRLPVIHVDAGLRDVLIYDCDFADVKEPASDLAIEAIRVGLGKGKTGLKINQNRFNNYYGDSEVISVKCDNVVVTNNTFLNSRSGVCIRHGNYCVIRGNYFENVYTPVRVSGKAIQISENTFKNKNNRSIFLMFGGKNYLQVIDLMVYNNKFFDYFNVYGIQAEGHALYPTKVFLKGNTLVKNHREELLANGNWSFNANSKKILVKTSPNQIKEYILK